MQATLQVDKTGELSRSLLDKSGLCIARLDHGLRVVEANAEFGQVFGATTGFVDALHPSIQTRFAWQFARLLDGRHARFAERVVARRTRMTGELTGIAEPDGTGRVEAVIVLVTPEGRASEAPGNKAITDLDAKVLEGVALGLSTAELSVRLHLSRGGIEYHVNGLMRRFRASNRSALVSKAYAAGMLNVGDWPPRVVPDFVK